MIRPYERKYKLKSGKERRAWMVEYRDPDGNRQRRQFPRKLEADRFCESLARGAAPPIQDEAVTVGQAADRWLRVCELVGRDGRPPVEPATLARYKIHVEKHIKPRIGSRVVSTFTVRDAKAFQLELAADPGLSAAMRSKIFTSTKALFAEAVGVYIDMSPFAHLKLSAGSRRLKRKIAIPTLEEVRLILQKSLELRNEKTKWKHAGKSTRRARAWSRYAPMIWLFVFTGMRASEVRGLPWDNVDLDEGVVTVRQRADEKGRIGPPKSAAGNRDIDIPGDLISLLKEWRKVCPPSRLNLVFPTGAGGVETHSNIRSRCWMPLMEACGLLASGRRGAGHNRLAWLEPPEAKFTFHPLRHLRSSLTLAMGGSVKDAMSQAGHSTIAAAEIYQHLLMDPELIERRRELSGRVVQIISGELEEEGRHHHDVDAAA
jgi:integrase